MSHDRTTGAPGDGSGGTFRPSMGPEQRNFALSALRGRVIQALYHAQSWEPSPADPYSFTLKDGDPETARPTLHITLNKLAAENGTEVIFRSANRPGVNEQPFTYSMKFHKTPGTQNEYYIAENATYAALSVQHTIFPKSIHEMSSEDQGALEVPEELARKMGILLFPNIGNTHPAVSRFAEIYSNVQLVVDAMHLGYAPAEYDIPFVLPNVMSPVTIRGYDQGKHMMMQLMTNADSSLADIYLGTGPTTQFGHDGRINAAFGGTVILDNLVQGHLLFDALRRYQEQNAATLPQPAKAAIASGLKTLLRTAIQN